MNRLPARFLKSALAALRVAVVAALLGLTVGSVASAQTELMDIWKIPVMERVHIQFNPDNPDELAPADVEVLENGRVVRRKVAIPNFDRSHTIFAQVAIHPIPKDERNVCDKWDRAGDVRLVLPDEPPIELVKFVTSYGGYAEFIADVTHLAPLLRDSCTLEAFIDTWVTPAWTIDVDLVFEAADVSEYNAPTERPIWVEPVMFTQSYNAQDVGPGGIVFERDLPADADRVKLYYFASGHCTDGRGADEFVTTDNVLSVDGVVVYRFRPWRDDCREFRDVNPYTARWSDGWWSSDFSRSGWCPGDAVEPLVVDLTDHLTPGSHRIGYEIEDVRPVDSAGHFGYWRVSSYVVGFEEIKPADQQ